MPSGSDVDPVGERLFRVIQWPVLDEFLNTELFPTAPEAQLLADCWRWEYNTFRPHLALKGHTPLEAAQSGAAA